MRMDDEFLETMDIDWFARDRDGRLMHFATGGRGHVPEEVACSVARWSATCEAVDMLPEVYDVLIVEDALPPLESKEARARFVKSYAAMARRGLYSHDVCDGGYTLIARPKVERPVILLSDEAESGIQTVDVSCAEEGCRVIM